jgi:addiction module HigA family antidote
MARNPVIVVRRVRKVVESFPDATGPVAVGDLGDPAIDLLSQCGLSLNMSKRSERLPPVHPGDVLREDFMKPLGLSNYAVAKAIGATSIAVSQICRRRRGVSAEMALKLGRLFNVSPELWMGIQADYDLEVARLQSQKRIDKLARPLPVLQSAAD